jgi:hypothetical protein
MVTQHCRVGSIFLKPIEMIILLRPNGHRRSRAEIAEIVVSYRPSGQG